MAKKLFITLLLLAFSSPVAAAASSHYNFEHAEEMRLSGRVNWRDFGPDAFAEAITENKPIFLMLTAPSWCYWCHVYTSDDYVYHPDIYPIIDEKFIPIYVDADKRQDLTREYLEGGWPSTTVMAPNGERMFGYSGPRPLSFMQTNLNQAFDHVQQTGYSNVQNIDYTKTIGLVPSQTQLNRISSGFHNYTLQAFDPVMGGFGNNRKFPQGRTLDAALDQYEATDNAQWLEVVQTTLANQYTDIDEIETNYNLFDPVEGGFHRYGTTREWSPPHYEKMLYDNVRLLQAYVHLQQVAPQSDHVDEVVNKTLDFIEREWWDEENGGFYGNSDVHGEDQYYGLANRPKPPPRVEQTKYSDWNSDAVVAYLDIWQRTDNEKIKTMAAKTLDLLADEMVTDQGAYHYLKVDGEKGVRGSILDNAYLMLAFTEGYEKLEDKSYLDTAVKLADYSLDNLYDWYSGGFFERNSPDLELYPPGGHLNLQKPSQENGIAAFAMLKLYALTDNIAYLNAGLKTLGALPGGGSVLDRGYYFVAAAEFATENNLLKDYDDNIAVITELEKIKQADFWLNPIIEKPPTAPSQKFEVSEVGLETLQGSTVLLILVALLAGLISFASPCTLPILPAYLAYTFRAKKQKTRGMTIAFFLGLSATFTILGMSATLLGTWLRDNLTLFTQIAGLAILAFGVYILAGKGMSGIKINKKRPTTLLGSFSFGAALGISWTPCVGPILVAILLLASTSSSVAVGGLLLFAYAVGLAIPLLLVSFFLDKINKQSRFWKILEGKEIKIAGRSIHTSALVSGLIFIIIGYLIFSGTLTTFNQYVSSTTFQKLFFGMEEWLLGFVR